MANVTVISVQARPWRAANLCFESGGVLGDLDVDLGARVSAFDFAAFYATLRSSPVSGDPARLLYDSPTIDAFVKPFVVAALRSELGAAALDKAVRARANAFYSKYANTPDLIATMTSFYSPANPDSKPVRLRALSSIAQNQMNQFRQGYLPDDVGYVVGSESTIVSKFDAKGSGSGSGDSVTGATETRTSESSSSSGHTDETQTIMNTDFSFHHPYLESLAQYQRAQISLIDEQFSQYMSGQNLPYLAAVLGNELASIDLDVFRLQVSYLNSILLSPLSGTVTGLYKNRGDAVAPGEPVLRIEDNSEVLLVARLVYRGRIVVGSAVTFKTQLFDATDTPVTITGVVVSARGSVEDEQWEVIAACNNLDGGGQPVLPFGYRFDYDNAQVSFA